MTGTTGSTTEQDAGVDAGPVATPDASVDGGLAPSMDAGADAGAAVTDAGPYSCLADDGGTTDAGLCEESVCADSSSCCPGFTCTPLTGDPSISFCQQICAEDGTLPLYADIPCCDGTLQRDTETCEPCAVDCSNAQNTGVIGMSCTCGQCLCPQNEPYVSWTGEAYGNCTSDPCQGNQQICEGGSTCNGSTQECECPSGSIPCLGPYSSSNSRLTQTVTICCNPSQTCVVTENSESCE